MEEKKNGLHVGIIMDGNGRWATKRGQPRLFGHAAGVKVVHIIVRECPSIGVHTVTLFAFAIANWKREKKEVDGLWVLFHEFMQNSVKEMLEEGTRLIFIGDKKGIPERVRTVAEKLEEDSKDNTTILLQIALNYDGVDEVARMMRRTIAEGVAVEDVTSKYVQTHLDTQSGNEPDVIVRTGMPETKEGLSAWRSSGFLPIQSAQSVCVSTEVLWPDFTIKHLEEIIDYASPEERLYGGQRKKV